MRNRLRIRTFLYCLLGALALVIAPLASAAEIYTWVDKEGVTHFSQSPPAQSEADVQVLRLDTQGFTTSPSRVSNIMDIANQLEASRLARQKAALERELAQETLELEQQRLEQEALREPVPVYDYAIPLRHKKKHPHWRPRHPGHKPPEGDDEPPAAERGPRAVEHGTTHLKPYKSLR